jgi:hypothetical protein
VASEVVKEPTERTLRWRRVFFGVATADDGKIVLAELGRELGAFTYQDPDDPASVVKQSVWKMILGRLGIMNARSLEQCTEYVRALSQIPPVAEEVISEQEEEESHGGS